jgi:hypothetical protein
MQSLLKNAGAVVALLLQLGSTIADDSNVSSFQIEPVEPYLSAEPSQDSFFVEPTIAQRVAQLESEFDELALQKDLSHKQSPSLRTCTEPMLFASVEWIHWQVRARERLQTLHNLAFNQNVFSPDIREPLQFKHTSGIRTSLGYQFRDGWQLSCIYTYLRPHGRNVDFGERDFEIDYNVVDLQVLRSIHLNESLRLSVFGGVRWIDLEQSHAQLFQNYVNNVVVSTTRDSMTDKTQGVGLRTGASASWQCWRKLSFFGRGACALLSQESTRTYSYESTVDTDSSTDGLPILENAVGVAWDYRRLQIKSGYEMATWFNVTDVGVMHPYSGLENQTRTLTFDGLFIELAMRF